MSTLLDRKDRIIYTTIDVMDEFGIQNVSTREIARREGVSEGAIFRHYPKKNDLFMAVLDFYSRYDEDIYESIKLKNLKGVDAISYVFNIYASYYQNYPAITVITQIYDVMRYNPDLKERIKNIFENRISYIEKLIEEGKKDGVINKKLNSGILAWGLIGAFDNICLQWRFEDYSFSFKDKSMEAIDTILETIKVK